MKNFFIIPVLLLLFSTQKKDIEIKRSVVTKTTIQTPRDADQNDLFFKIAAFVSPLLAGTLSGFITYGLTIKSKKFDILYANKIPAFKEIAKQLLVLKQFLIAKIADKSGMEFSPEYEDTSILNFITEISSVREANYMFTSKKSQLALNSLLDNMSLVANFELQQAAGVDGFSDGLPLYNRLLTTTSETLDILFNELNIK
jgi:hypothetical protein